MASSLSRLTLYSLITATEEDMRSLLSTYTPHGSNVAALLGPDLHMSAKDRAHKDESANLDNLQLEDLLQYCDFGDLVQCLSSIKACIPEDIRPAIQQMASQLKLLAGIRNRVMHARPLDFEDLIKYSTLVDDLLISNGFWPNLSEAKKQIAQSPEYLLRTEVPIIPDSSTTTHNLPIPDFDETGFIGRKAIVERVKKACTGVYPVVTIVGEGGLGKTALALRVAYDLIDDPTNPFEAIVFVSAKTTQLTTNEILRIQGAISSSMGLIKKAVSALGGESDDPIEELLQLLSEFKVLVIVDNLETVVDHHLRTILENIPDGSHILITSRIGLGAFEYPILLPELTSDEAVQLLRATAKTRGTDRLVQASNQKLAEYCGRMQKNPLYIKWFVSAVQAGKRPEDTLANNRLFLQFCLSNVNDKLTPDARTIVRTLLAVGGTFSVPELAFMTSFDELALLRAVQELMRTNMITMSNSPLGRSFETRYELSTLARKYLSQFQPVSKDEQRRLLGIKKRLVSAGEEIAGMARSQTISVSNINVRNRSDWVIAKYLKDALSEHRRGRSDACSALLERAKGFAPDYFEVYRVSAWIDADNGNVTGAYENYEKAIEIEPESISTLVMYAGFLLREVQDAELAEPYYKKACQLAPELMDPKIELARCLMYQKNFAEARRIVFDEIKAPPSSEASSMKLKDIRIQVLQREADFLCMQRETRRSLSVLDELKDFLGRAEDVDFKILSRLRKLGPTFTALQGATSISTDDAELLSKLHRWFEETIKESPGPAPGANIHELVPPDEVIGTIVRLPPYGKFGFVKIEDGTEIFFHRNSIRDPQLKTSIKEGVRVTFTPGVDWRGRVVALNIHRQ